MRERLSRCELRLKCLLMRAEGLFAQKVLSQGRLRSALAQSWANRLGPRVEATRVVKTFCSLSGELFY